MASHVHNLNWTVSDLPPLTIKFLRNARAQGFVVWLYKPNTVDNCLLPHEFEVNGYDVSVSYVDMTVGIPTLTDQIYTKLLEYMTHMYGEPNVEDCVYWDML